MSDSSSSDRSGADPSLLDRLDEWYHVPAMIVILGYMLWVRTRSYDNFIVDGEVFFSGNDPYYHYREVTYIVTHWPQTMPFDPWTYYPYGTSADQFGTLFDQLVATAALVVGLGDPSSTLVAKTLLVAPAVFGTLAAVPVFFMGRRLGGRFGGLFGVVVLALMPGAFLRRALVGSADHHAAEVLFQAFAVLALMVALAVAEREKPIYELVLDRDFDTLRSPLGWAILAGVAMALYIWTWPPGMLLFAIVGVFLAVKLSAAYLNGDSPEPVAFAGAVSLGVAGLLSMLPMNSLQTSPTAFGLLQPLLAFGGAVGCVFMAWLAREWDARDLDRRLYPATVVGIVLVGAGVVSLVLPDLFDLMVKNFKRFIGFSAGAESRTIREAQPFLAQAGRGVEGVDLIFREYGAMFYVAVATAGFVLVRPLLGSTDVREQGVGLGAIVLAGLVWQFDFGTGMSKTLPLIQEPVLWEMALVVAAILVVMLLGDHDAEEMFVVTWALFMTAAAFTQVRFNYYLAAAVAVLTAYAVGQLMEFLGVVTPEGRIRSDIEPYQVMALMLALLVVMPGLMVPVQIAGSERNPVTTSPSWKVGNSSGPGDVTKWEGSLGWMQNNTPAEGTFGEANDSMAYYGTYERPPDGDFQYGNGTYGVMSWWDYGHWITVEGKRIPNANPFQQGATTAANYLLAPNETRANSILDEMGDRREETRYVMVDWKMVHTRSKFGAPVIFYTDANVSRSDFVRTLLSRQGRPITGIKTQRYYNSTMVRLYRFHGSAVQPKPYVVQWNDVQGRDGRTYRLVPQSRSAVRAFESVPAARAYAANHSNVQVGGIGNAPPEYVPAMEHYRLVQASQETARGPFLRPVFQLARQAQQVNPQRLLGQTALRNTNWVKTFERVPGATLAGEGPENATVSVSVQMRMPSTNQTFTYTQRARTGPDGEFEVTVPYSTTGYENYGPENGYTNVSVRATGPYTVRTGFIPVNNSTLATYSATVNVSESQVLGLNDSKISFEMTERTFDISPGDGNESDTNNSTGTNSSTVTFGSSTAETRTLADGGDTQASRDASAGTVSLGGAPEPDTRRPTDGATRGGLLLVLFAGLLVEARD